MSANPPIMTAPSSMPFKGYASASRFKGNNPCKLQCYFEELKFLFITYVIIDNDLIKKYMVCYVDIDTEDSWKQLSKFTNDLYIQFKNAIFKLYPGANSKCK